MSNTRGPAPTTVGEWLASRVPPPPVALATRLKLALSARADDPLSSSPAAFLAGAEDLLKTLLQNGSTSRETALDLLTVDALVTYAFESAAELGDMNFDKTSGEAMRRIAAVSAQYRSTQS